MHVTRTQYPVGQGCFHAGRIRRGNETPSELGDFHYIYDCGSKHGSALREAIGTYRTQTSHVNALFVSHLHEDHVNGIDRLLGAVKVDTVYLPYVDNVMSVLNVIEADVNGALSASLVEASIDPRSWFGRRGVSRVVRVVASSGHGFPDDAVDVADDTAPDDRSLEVMGDALESEAESSKRAGSRSSLEQIRSGEMVRVSVKGVPLDWVLVPHVDPAPVRRRQAFMKDLRVACGLLPRERLTAARLADALRTRSKRINLKNCYERIISGGSSHNHNRVSMSLYSGPADVAGSKESRLYRVVRRTAKWSVCSNMLTPVPWWLLEPEAAGWVGTGDATLGRQDVRAAWRMTFDPFGGEIGTLLLPHHGSARNFHSELLDFPQLELCVASAGDPSPYRHPGLAVVHQVVKRGKKLHCVSANPLSGLYEEIVEM